MKSKEIYIPKLSTEITYWIGSNAQDNFNIIEQAEPTDIWFHIGSHPSAHIIARISHLDKLDKKSLQQIVTQGAVLCKQVSKYSSVKNLDITWAYISNVKLTNILGTVNVSCSKNIII
jgi:predicted ribosome quality control (RQC) complex YloA/Tae2 family protein